MRKSARERTDAPMAVDGPVQESGGSNKTPPGPGNVTGEKVLPAGVRTMTEERDRTEGRENSSNSKYYEISYNDSDDFAKRHRRAPCGAPESMICSVSH